jgi:hypothetical protein
MDPLVLDRILEALLVLGIFHEVAEARAAAGFDPHA